MCTMKRASIAAAAAALALTLVGCSEAEKAADEAKKKAGEAGSSMAAEASEKGRAKAEELASKATSGADGASDGATDDSGASGSGDGNGSGEDVDSAASDGAGGAGSAGGVTVDLGDFADDPAAEAAGAFYTEREGVRTGGEGDLTTVTTAGYLPKVERFIKNHPAKSSSLRVVVTGVSGSTVDACVGPKAQRPRVLTIKDGKVARITKGSFDC